MNASVPVHRPPPLWAGRRRALFTEANAARIQNYLLGGKDNYAVDRDLAERILAVQPHWANAARAGRAFTDRAVRALLARGVRQFIDVGCGLPLLESAEHGIATRHAPSARVVYVDHDPMVLAHARALLSQDAEVAVIDADLRRRGALLGGAFGCGLLDEREPIAVLLTSVLHFLTEADRPHDLLAEIRDVVAPGSALVISHATADFSPEPSREAARLFSEASSCPLVLRGEQEIGRYFGDFELADPGLVPTTLWRPKGPARGAHQALMYAGVGIRAS
ncbi:MULTISPECIES: SAM-dependent methyltransferase [Thermomonosporaceae]|uniref:SAM-dependent methyltransferase n=1 Tax=Thermomonosporaceae TaxID=2012 RepID=UPI00255AD880|nr:MULTISPECIES: SAM-dependent methyltransferase [Thermomonosporaceae]MDL4770816.1 SAM-dependent methyltransferase [Actinomadura xylanilytica]